MSSAASPHGATLPAPAESASHPPAPVTPRLDAPAERLVSLDAFRGAVMLLMASGGLGLAQIVRHHPDSATLRFLAHHSDHAAWVGCTLWDLIQPAFMFMVGVALPWSLANRRARGATFGAMLRHALVRSAILVALGVFLASAWSTRTEWMFTNVLAQIGLGYPFLFLLGFTRDRTIWLASAALLVATWLAFALHPIAPPDFDFKRVGVPDNWIHLTGFAAHWQKNANLGAAFDACFLNLFPRAAPFTHNAGGYVTLNFVPSLATMLFGLLAGRLLRSDAPVLEKARRLALFGLAGLILGYALHALGICPLVKRLWTPSWTLFSAGWVALLLAAFVGLIDARGWKRWAFPFVVAGLNPITLYLLWQLMSRSTRETLQTHLGRDVFDLLGPACAPMLQRALPLLIFWLILYAMYRRRLFLKI